MLMTKRLLHWLNVCVTVYGLSWLEFIVLPYLDIHFKGPVEPKFATANLYEEILLNLEFALFIAPVTGTVFLLAYVFVLRQREVNVNKLGVVVLATQLIAVGAFLLTDGKIFGPFGYFGVLPVIFFLGIALLHFVFKERSTASAS